MNANFQELILMLEVARVDIYYIQKFKFDEHLRHFEEKACYFIGSALNYTIRGG